MQDVIKIAVCDDSIFDREITVMYIQDYIEQKGISADIDTYSSGDEFLQSDLAQYSLAFLDIYMAGINGIETAKKILEINKDIKIVFSSSSPEFADESNEISAFHYFIKPITREKFAEVMESFLTA